MPLIRKHSTGNGRVERLVPLSAVFSAAGITLTVLLPIIGFLGGERYNEYSQAVRLIQVEKDLTVVAEGLKSLYEWKNGHENLSNVRAATIEQLRLDLRMMEQRERFRHNDNGRFGADVMPPGKDDPP